MGLEEGGELTVNEVLECADEDRCHGDGAKRCWFRAVAFAFPQRHHVGLRPLLGQYRVKPGVGEHCRQRSVCGGADMAKEDGEDGVAAGSRVRVLTDALLFDVLGSESPAVADMRG